MTDIVEPDGDLWNWVVQNGGQPKEALWPLDSETAAGNLATAWTESAKALRDAVQLSDNAAGELRKVWTDAAGFELYYAIHSMNNGSLGETGIKEMAVVMDGLSGTCREYGELVVSAKNAIRKNISDNNELFGRCTSWAARTVFAIKVAHGIATMMNDFATKVGKPAGGETKQPKKPKSHGFWGNIGEFFVGVWEGAVEMFVGFAALAGYSDRHFSWSTFGQAWKGLGQFGLAVATYTSPALAHLDQTVGLPGFERGAMGDTLKEAGKAMVAWDTWSEDPSRAAGKATFNIASAVLGTKGAGAAIRGAGAAAAGSKVSAVAAVGRVAEKAGTAITKIPTGTELAAKAARKIPGVDSLLAKVGLGHPPAGVPAHAGDTPPPPHTPRTPDDTPPTNPPGDRTPDGPPPERPPNRPPGDKTPEHVPDERRPARTPEERTPDTTPEPSTHPEPATRPEPSTRPGSVGETMEQGARHTSGKDVPEQASPAPKANEEAPAAPAREHEGTTPARAENPSEAARPAASEAPARHEEAPVHHERTNTAEGDPEAAGHRARDTGEPRATINPETGEVRMSDRVDPADTRESTVLPEDETVRKAQQEWATAAPVQPKTPTQKAIYTTARVLGLVHVGEDMALGHHITPSSEPPTPHPTKEPTPKDKEKTPEKKSTTDSLPDGDPGLPPKRDTTFVDVDLDAGKPRLAGDPDTPPPPKPEPPKPEPPDPTPTGPREPKPDPTPRPAGGAADPPPARGPRTHRSNMWDPAAEPGPRRPGSRFLSGDPVVDNAHRRRPEHPMRGGEHPQRVDPPHTPDPPRTPDPPHTPDPDVPPSRVPDEDVPPPPRDIDSAINPEPARAHPDGDGPHEGGHRDHDGDDTGDQHTPHEDAHVPDDAGPPPYDPVPAPRTIHPDSPEYSERFADWNRPDDSAFEGPRERPGGHDPIGSPKVIDDVEPRTRNRKLHKDGIPQPLRGEKPLAANAEYGVRYKNGASSRFFTDADGRVTHVETTLANKKPFHNPDLRHPLQPNTQYRVPNFHDPSKHWTFEIGANGKPSAMTGDPVFKGKHDDFRDNASQNRSGKEGAKAYKNHPVYKKLFSHVRWAGGHFSAHEMGGPGEYVNMHPQMAASNSGHYRDGWIHDASWRAQEAELGKFADVPGQKIENYQVRMEGSSNGIPENTTMRWQEVVHQVDAQGNVVHGPDGKPIELSRVTRQRDFPNDPSKVNYGPDTHYGADE
ncbi:WXG100-like domain-containing protein [Amycolatopsis azurea]|uniref:Outer membrane channel protein CpnT-like N-terminal domain-containing protein n=1 Tax=Amycolatopsis azurea DSM 43854 TaxID=1238180 RepID=M2NUW1_9PSEU|nr:hypothetical protein [Amycolatopsis azurea]EMD26309.1 hypothetical protein C791_3611 [Amycolatopsis azurea DSM 43854]OOC07751.1 hypothetical protein B0293_06370 [Amycolatopsis azurea DSM 43854]